MGISPALRTELEEALEEQGTLSDVIAWMARVGGMEIVVVVEQDEFSNDVVLRWQEGLFLVYGCT